VYCCAWDCAATSGGHFASICDVDLDGYQIGCVTCGYRDWDLFGLENLNVNDQRGAITFSAQHGILKNINVTASRAVLGSAIYNDEYWATGDMQAKYMTIVNDTGFTIFEAMWRSYWAELSYGNFLYNNAEENLVTITFGRVEYCYFYQNDFGNRTVRLKDSDWGYSAILIIENCVLETSERDSYDYGGNVLGSNNVFDQTFGITWAICQLNTVSCVAQTICLTSVFVASSNFSYSVDFSNSPSFSSTSLF
jgi:hypothetical protein